MKTSVGWYRAVALVTGFSVVPLTMAISEPEPDADSAASIQVEAASPSPPPTDANGVIGAEILSQETGAPPSQATIDRYLTMIDQLEAEGDSYDMKLAETVYGLGRVLQQTGQHNAAIPAFRRALQITRVNDGLYSPSQEPMIRGMIESQKASKLYEEAADQYQHLFWIKARAYGETDPRLIPLLDEVSRWHLHVYSSEPDRSKLQHLVESQSLTASAINLVAASSGPFSLGLIPLLRNVVRSSFYLARYQQDYPDTAPEPAEFTVSRVSRVSDPFPSREQSLMGHSYSNGREAYEKIIEILHNNPEASNREKAVAFAELGDWYLIFGRRSSAWTAYGEAYRLLTLEANYKELVNELFGTPRLLPLILDDRENSAPETFVRVELDVAPSGVARNIRVLETYPEDSEKLANTAKRMLRDARFRPILIDGEPATATAMQFKLLIAEG